MPTRVLIADDHAVFRSRLRTLLEAWGYEVVGEATDGASAITMIGVLEPDLLVLDVQLPDRDGFSIASEIAAGGRRPQIVLISTREASDYGSALVQAPASGFIHKPHLSRASLERLVNTPG